MAKKGLTTQVEVILDLLEDDELKGGFFIETGAHDWEYLSHTLYLEVISEEPVNNYELIFEPHRTPLSPHHFCRIFF